MKITELDKKGLDLIAEVEGCVLHPYLDTANIPTIGIGSTRYENKVRVTMKDPVITIERAYELCKHLCMPLQVDIDTITRDDITQNQFNALVSFCYNGGIGMLKGSTLLKMINLNPNDPKIADEFMKFIWEHKHNKDGTVTLEKVQGLVNRRKKEVSLYFS